MTLKCVAIDDEPLALDLLEDYIKQIPFIELIGKSTSPMQVMDLLLNQQVDILFLDIQMPDITGIQLLNSLENPPMVIFTTAYNQYAVEGYELNAIDYLLKPISFERFLKAIQKAYTQYSLRMREATDNASAAPKNSSNNDDFIFVKSDYRIIKLHVADITFIEGLKDYVKIHTPEKTIITLLSLKHLEEKLQSKGFMRVHRSYIVSLSKIESIERNRIKIGGQEIPVGENYGDNFYSEVQRHNL